VPLQYVDGNNEVAAVGIVVEGGDPIILRAPLDFGGPQSPKAEVPAAPAGDEGGPEGAAEGVGGVERLSAFSKVLDGIECVIESAAAGMEAIAGGVTSPRQLGLKGGEHEN
jgi:hypothetical protein